MSVTEKRTELLVGLFVFFGLAIMAVLILQFGRFGERIRETYPLRVQFSNAYGIRDGIDVRVGGVKVGSAIGKPQPDATLQNVLVELSIYSEYQFPDNSEIRITSAGLMGDYFISIKIEDPPSANFYTSDQVIQGKAAGDISELTDNAEILSKKAEILITEFTETLVEVRAGIEDLNSAVGKFDDNVLGDENLTNIREAIANFRELSDNLSDASDKLGPAVDQVQGAVQNANGAFEGAQEIVIQLQPVVADLERAANAANQGDGLLNALLTDDALRADFIALIANLKEHGVLRYKDTATGTVSTASPATPPAPAAPEKKSWRPFNRKR